MPPHETVAAVPKLLHLVRLAARVRHYSPRTEEAYVAWVRRSVRYNGLRHSVELGPQDVRVFLGVRCWGGSREARNSPAS
jgi:Phage integrase, N-terminal SAM-like domain